MDYPEHMDTEARTPALKQWATIVDAMLTGRQIVDLRKGGIHEENRRFSVRSSKLWLYPAYEHQRRELLKPEWQPALERSLASAPPAGTIRIEAWAEITDTATVAAPEALAPLDAEFAWTRSYAERRLHWKPRQPLWVLVLRVHRLAEALVVPWREQYRGCTSWVDLVDLPDNPAVLASPVLDDVAFEERRMRLLEQLPAGALDRMPIASA